MRTYRNWPAICALSDPHLKLCLTLMENEHFLERLSVAFPELFVDEKPEHNGPWSLSIIHRVFATMDTEWATFTSEQLEEALGLPVTYVSSSPNLTKKGPHGSYGHLSLSEDERRELLNNWDRERYFPEKLNIFMWNGEPHYVIFAGDEDGDCVQLVHTTLVDVNS